MSYLDKCAGFLHYLCRYRLCHLFLECLTLFIGLQCLPLNSQSEGLHKGTLKTLNEKRSNLETVL